MLSFEAASRRVHELHLPTWRNEKHGRDFISSLESYAFPRIGAVRQSRAMTSTKLALEFLVLTAARSGEVRETVWEEVDDQRRCG